MADSWMWWMMTCAISLYFVMLLLDFNNTHRNSAPETHTRENVWSRLAISDQDG